MKQTLNDKNRQLIILLTRLELIIDPSFPKSAVLSSIILRIFFSRCSLILTAFMFDNAFLSILTDNLFGGTTTMEIDAVFYKSKHFVPERYIDIY